MNFTLAQALRRAVHLRGMTIGLVDGERQFTWKELDARIRAFAAGLSLLGVTRGDRVVFLAPNSHRVFEAYFAAVSLGAIIAPLNPRMSDKELAALLLDADPAALIVGGDFLERATSLRQGLPTLKSLIWTGEGTSAPGSVAYESVRESGLGLGIDPTETSPDDVACLFYTGGTTGEPKGVMLTHSNITANSVNFISHVGLDQSAVHLHCGPLFHVAAAVRLFSVTLAAGRHVMLPRFELPQVIETIEQAKVNIATFVPTMLRAIIDRADLANYDLSSLKYITYGAAPMSESLLRQAIGQLPHVRFVQSYGMTETSPIATMLGFEDHALNGPTAHRLRSAGRAALLAEIKIQDVDGITAEVGKPGQILVRGPMVMKGYWRNSQATDAAVRDGWLHTGDIGYLDADGYLYVTDRLKDVIITGGENVYSQEVENAIAAHPAIRECAVFGRPHVKWGEAVHAVVVLKPNVSLTSDQLLAHCRQMIAGYKCPKTVQFREAPLPLSGANKVLKTQLRAELLAQEANEL